MYNWNSPRMPRKVGVRWLLLMALFLLPILAACSSGRRAPTPTPTRAAALVPTAAQVAGPPPPPTPAPEGPLPAARQGLDLTILHTNDVRGEIEPCG